MGLLLGRNCEKSLHELHDCKEKLKRDRYGSDDRLTEDYQKDLWEIGY